MSKCVRFRFVFALSLVLGFGSTLEVQASPGVREKKVECPVFDKEWDERWCQIERVAVLSHGWCPELTRSMLRWSTAEIKRLKRLFEDIEVDGMDIEGFLKVEKSFLQFIEAEAHYTDEGLIAVLDDVGYYAPTDAERSQQVAFLDSLIGDDDALRDMSDLRDAYMLNFELERMKAHALIDMDSDFGFRDFNSLGYDAEDPWGSHGSQEFVISANGRDVTLITNGRDGRPDRMFECLYKKEARQRHNSSTFQRFIEQLGKRYPKDCKSLASPAASASR